jgi:hypothetical protein
MMTLLDRIRRGEQAIAEAKAEGREVPTEWQNRLAELKKIVFETTTTVDANGRPECFNCGATMTMATDIYGRSCWVCWECAVTV